jgi:hypothetical protein
MRLHFKKYVFSVTFHVLTHAQAECIAVCRCGWLQVKKNNLSSHIMVLSWWTSTKFWVCLGLKFLSFQVLAFAHNISFLPFLHVSLFRWLWDIRKNITLWNVQASFCTKRAIISHHKVPHTQDVANQCQYHKVQSHEPVNKVKILPVCTCIHTCLPRRWGHCNGKLHKCMPDVMK